MLYALFCQRGNDTSIDTVFNSQHATAHKSCAGAQVKDSTMSVALIYKMTQIKGSSYLSIRTLRHRYLTCSIRMIWPFGKETKLQATMTQT